jgi:hypothetical protein
LIQNSLQHTSMRKFSIRTKSGIILETLSDFERARDLAESIQGTEPIYVYEGESFIFGSWIVTK